MLTGRFQLATPDGEAARARRRSCSGSVRAREGHAMPPPWTSGAPLDARRRRDRPRSAIATRPRWARSTCCPPASSGPWPGWAATTRAPTPTTRPSRSRSGATRIRRHPGELKNLLRNQAFVAGIGNAYSDEILHAARLLPFRKRSTPGGRGGRRAVRGDADDARDRDRRSCASGSRRRSRSRSATSSRSTTRAASRVRAAARGSPRSSAGGFITSYCRGCQR